MDPQIQFLFVLVIIGIAAASVCLLATRLDRKNFTGYTVAVSFSQSNDSITPFEAAVDKQVISHHGKCIRAPRALIRKVLNGTALLSADMVKTADLIIAGQVLIEPDSRGQGRQVLKVDWRCLSTAGEILGGGSIEDPFWDNTSGFKNKNKILDYAAEKIISEVKVKQPKPSEWLSARPDQI